jgi:hypothetical protein
MDCATISSDVIGDFQEPYRAVLVDGDDIASIAFQPPSTPCGAGAALPARGPLQVNALQADARPLLARYARFCLCYRSQAPRYPRVDTYAKKSRRRIPRCTGYKNRMFALVTASQMASASAASVFCRLRRFN